MLQTLFLSATILLAINPAKAQQVDLAKGDLSILKGETTINIEFTYEKITVGDDGKGEAYIKRKTQEMNER